MSLDPETTQLLDILHRGGAFGYWWTLEQQRSFWWEVGVRAPLPTGRRNIYVGVHPTTEIPATNMQGTQKPARELRAQLPIIAALNCLYCEVDAKDYADGKDGAWDATQAIEPPPSVIVDSGGGYHLYWLFHEPWLLGGDEDRERAKRLQAAWVAYTGGDPAVKDLARVLRVPGTHNYKYEPAPLVTIVHADFDVRYTHDELAAFCRGAEQSTPPGPAGSVVSPSANGSISHDGYVRAALDGEALRVLRAGPGVKHDAIRTAAINLGTLVARGVLEEHTAFDELARAAAHRADVKDTEHTIRDGLTYGMQRPRDIPEPRTNGHTPRGRQGVRLSDAPQDEPPAAEQPEITLPLLIRADGLHALPPATPIIPNLIYINKLHQWFGAPGSGKSFLALDVATTVAQTRRVVYIAAEAIEDYESRLDAWKAHHKHGTGELYFWRDPLALADERAVQQFCAAIAELKPDLIVLDPLADCMTGLDESSARDMSIAVFALNTIRRLTRAAVLVIHHTGWSQDHERGHSLLRGACRVVARVEASEDGLIRIICEKKNHGRKFDPRSFRLVSAGTMGGAVPLPARQVMPGKLRLTEKLLRVLEAMTTEPLRRGATHTDLVKGTDIPAATLNRLLTALADAGYITSEEIGRSTKYRLTARAHDALTVAAEDDGGSWNDVGRTLEEGGRTWNWSIALPHQDAENDTSDEWKNESRNNSNASSGVLAHQDAVLPSSSISLPLPPVYIYPKDIYTGAEDKKSPSSSSTATAAVPGVYSSEPSDEPMLKGFRAVDWFDEGAEPAAEAEPDEPGLFDEPAPARSSTGIAARLKALKGAE